MSFTAFGPMYRCALSLLPERMDSPAAWAMLYAIAAQESRLDERRQIGGPARGFWQFELGGIRGVLQHRASKDHIQAVLSRLDYDFTPEASYAAIEHNDPLAFCYARLLLYTLPQALPGRDQAEGAWFQYLDAWRPGKPHRASWDAFYEQGWKTTEGIT